MKNRTIRSSAIDAIRIANNSITVQEIYKIIIENELYEFRAKSPLAVLKSTLRKHTRGSESKKNEFTFCFEVDEKGRYSIL